MRRTLIAKYFSY